MILCDALNGGGECFCVLCFRSLSYFCWVWLFVAFLWVNLFSLRELVLIMKYHGWSGNWIFFRYNGAWALICFMLIVMNDAFMSYTHPLVVQRVYVRTPIVHSAAIVMPLLQHTAWIYVFFFGSPKWIWVRTSILTCPFIVDDVFFIRKYYTRLLFFHIPQVSQFFWLIFLFIHFHGFFRFTIWMLNIEVILR